MKEMRQSLRIISQCLTETPDYYKNWITCALQDDAYQDSLFASIDRAMFPEKVDHSEPVQVMDRPVANC